MSCTTTAEAMTVTASANAPAGASNGFDALGVLVSSGMATAKTCLPGETIFTQGDDCEDVLYIQAGGVGAQVEERFGLWRMILALDGEMRTLAVECQLRRFTQAQFTGQDEA